MLKFLGAFLCPLVACSPALAAGAVGVSSLTTIDDGRPLALTVWYPAGEGGTADAVGRNAVFTGAEGMRDAPVAAGPLPVIMLSHGGLRSASDSGAWLGVRLAGAGFVAVEVNGPRPESPAGAVDEIWRRPDDVTRALDALLGDKAWAGRVDPARVGVAGFALGGTAAMLLAGAGLDAATFAASCDAGQGPDCGWLAAQGVVLSSVDSAALAVPRRDGRVAAAVAIAPEYAAALAGETEVPVLVIGLGDAPAATSGAAVETLAGTVADGFSACTAKGPAILREEGGDPEICGADAAAREALHDAIAAQVVRFLGAPG